FDPWELDLYAGLLRSGGCHVVPCGDVGSVLPLANAHPPDLVIADVQSPWIAGLTLVDILRSNPTTRTVPVIAYSSDARMREPALEAGCTDFLLKPVSHRDLTQAVKHVLPAAE